MTSALGANKPIVSLSAFLPGGNVPPPYEEATARAAGTRWVVQPFVAYATKGCTLAELVGPSIFHQVHNGSSESHRGHQSFGG